MNNATLIFILNLSICIGIAWVCICRLNAISPQTMLRVRAKYTGLLGGSMFLIAFPFMFPNLGYTWGTVAVAALVLGLIVLEMPKWRHGPPPCSYRKCRQTQQQ